jgi:hypothetical protein
MSLLDDDLIDKVDYNVLINKILVYYSGLASYKYTENPQVIFEKPDIRLESMISEPEQYVLSVRYEYDTFLTLMHIDDKSRKYYKYRVTLLDILNHEPA